ncbi:rRNA maturation RNase YbeY [Muriicola soli]|uniref:Endoribonuclease YbeY n=1 Tax=Muriicola soli TaxID=2507538 RepID=A0A411ECH6_9FLAO|nr:rRNA maturation RNase YbeY [Muriicola soli]QBA65379.1 rRNA maturation RNase YbeY [Muriicola soli]
MIEYVYKTRHTLENESKYTEWFKRVLASESKNLSELCFVLTNDEELLEINQEYLGHDYYTDIITFNYNNGNEIQGDIFISVDRVKENAVDFNVEFDRELQRVMVHGLLHLLGYNDETEYEKSEMRKLEENKMEMFHVEQ